MDGHRFVIYDKTDAYELDLSGLEAWSDQRPNVIPTATFLLDDDHRLVEATLNGQEELRAVSEADADAFLRRP